MSYEIGSGKYYSNMLNLVRDIKKDNPWIENAYFSGNRITIFTTDKGVIRLDICHTAGTEVK